MGDDRLCTADDASETSIRSATRAAAGGMNGTITRRGRRNS